MFECLLTILGLATSGLVVLSGADAVHLALLSTAGSCSSLLGWGISCRRAPRWLAVASAAFILLFALNYPVQYLLTGLMYQSAEWSTLLRSISLRPVQAAWLEQIPVLCQINLALALLSGGFVLLFRAGRDHIVRDRPKSQWSRRGLGALFTVAIAAMVVGIPLQFSWGVGALGSEANSGYRLEGVLYHTLVTLLPVLLLTIHVAAGEANWAFLSRCSLGAFIVLALIETAMMSSRGYVALQMASVVLLYLWTSFRRRMAVVIVLATLVASLALYPIMTSVRIARSNLGFTPAESLSMALDNTQMEDLGRTSLLLMSRFVGYTSYLVTLQYANEPFDLSRIDLWDTITLRNSSLTRWYTETVAGYGLGVRGHFSSPGVMGAGHVLGGAAWALLLPALLAWAATWSVSVVANRAGVLGAVAPAVWLANALFVFNEGTLDLGFARLILTFGGLMLTGTIVRSVAAKPA